MQETIFGEKAKHMKLRPKSRLTGGKKIELDSLKVRKGEKRKKKDKI